MLYKQLRTGKHQITSAAGSRSHTARTTIGHAKWQPRRKGSLQPNWHGQRLLQTPPQAIGKLLGQPPLPQLQRGMHVRIICLAANCALTHVWRATRTETTC